MSKRPDPRQTIQKLIQARYASAKAVFWAGSVAQQKGTSASDLDLVIVYDAIPNAYREAYIYNDWPIDAFIHDIDTLRYFFEESRTGSGISGLTSMIVHGIEITEQSQFSENIKRLAMDIAENGPIAWVQEQIDKERFLITDALEDIQYPASPEEQIASAAWLYEALSQFYFRSKKQWCASGKSIVRYLQKDDPELALAFTQSFNKLFQTRDAIDLAKVTEKILKPFGGLFWNGFVSHAPKDFKILASHILSKTVAQSAEIRLLTVDDWQIWKDIRLEALQDSPENFGSAYEEELHWTDAEFQEGLTKSNIFGGFIDDKLVACAGFYSLTSLKTQHRGVIWGMYTRPEYRKQGVASALIQTVIMHARSRVLQLHLTCVTSNLSGIRFYQKQGFKIYGTEPRALKIDHTFYDEHLMVLYLNE